MISIEEALGKILNFVSVLEEERKPLLDCLGQVLAEDIYAPFDVPQQDNSAMDGYAVQGQSIANASPKHPITLRVVGEIAAGSVSEVRVEPETSVRIMTGAPLPDGANTVVPFELTDEADRKRDLASDTEIGISCSLPEGSNIRRHGEDIAKNALAMKKGESLGPSGLGVLASLGREVVSVIRRPVIAILATGNELLYIDQPLLPGKIYNSNTYSLAAQVLSYGSIPRVLGIAPDDIGQLSTALHRGFDCDMIITSGGVSLGDYDMVKQVLAAEGDISFWTVRMKPGKPLAFGTFTRDNGERIPHLGLPGNPVSSMITFEIFARPAMLKMMGKTNFKRIIMPAIMESTIKNNDGRRIYARVVIREEDGKYFASLTGPQGSGILTSMAMANGLAIIPETTKEVKPGATVDVMMLD